mmetsp:Transcript_63730/g.137036  ORF Transcript_63730/g.137036 Transcript_63730/m.137036 type:complete len:246 (-) Transcript_63730:2777-3514(-)
MLHHLELPSRCTNHSLLRAQDHTAHRAAMQEVLHSVLEMRLLDQVVAIIQDEQNATRGCRPLTTARLAKLGERSQLRRQLFQGRRCRKRIGQWVEARTHGQNLSKATAARPLPRQRTSTPHQGPRAASRTSPCQRARRGARPPLGLALAGHGSHCRSGCFNPTSTTTPNCDLAQGSDMHTNATHLKDECSVYCIEDRRLTHAMILSRRPTEDHSTPCAEVLEHNPCIQCPPQEVFRCCAPHLSEG